jgi:phage protein D
METAQEIYLYSYAYMQYLCKTCLASSAGRSWNRFSGRFQTFDQRRPLLNSALLNSAALFTQHQIIEIHSYPRGNHRTHHRNRDSNAWSAAAAAASKQASKKKQQQRQQANKKQQQQQRQQDKQEEEEAAAAAAAARSQRRSAAFQARVLCEFTTDILF